MLSCIGVGVAVSIFVAPHADNMTHSTVTQTNSAKLASRVPISTSPLSVLIFLHFAADLYRLYLIARVAQGDVYGRAAVYDDAA